MVPIGALRLCDVKEKWEAAATKLSERPQARPKQKELRTTQHTDALGMAGWPRLRTTDRNQIQVGIRQTAVRSIVTVCVIEQEHRGCDLSVLSRGAGGRIDPDPTARAVRQTECRSADRRRIHLPLSKIADLPRRRNQRRVPATPGHVVVAESDVGVDDDFGSAVVHARIGDAVAAAAELRRRADLAADAAVVVVGVAILLAAIGRVHVAVEVARVAGAHAAHAGGALRRRVRIRRTSFPAAAAVRDAGVQVGFTSIGDVSVAVVEAVVAAADAAVAGGAAGRSVGDGRTDFSACSAVASAGRGVGLAAIDRTGLARSERPRAHRRTAASRRAGRRDRAGLRTRVAAVAAVCQVARAVCLAAVAGVSVAVQEQPLAGQLALALDAGSDGICAPLTDRSAATAVHRVAEGVCFAAIRCAGIAVFVARTANRTSADSVGTGGITDGRRRTLIPT